MGGTAAATLTAPFDVLKTRLQSDYYHQQLLASRAARGVPPPSTMSFTPIFSFGSAGQDPMTYGDATSTETRRDDLPSVRSSARFAKSINIQRDILLTLSPLKGVAQGLAYLVATVIQQSGGYAFVIKANPL